MDTPTVTPESPAALPSDAGAIGGETFAALARLTINAEKLIATVRRLEMYNRDLRAITERQRGEVARLHKELCALRLQK